MNHFVAPPAASARRQWRARLDLSLQRRGSTTVVAHRQHEGPLVVQRPFYPEGGHCHLYLLHPPGGIAAGDKLDCRVQLGPQAGALLTTPSAGKIYSTDRARHRQQQTFAARVDSGALLEWLPQETIVFAGANVELCTRIELAADAKLVGWDFVCLGRRASGEQFLQGECVQRIELDRDNQPLLRERTHWVGGTAMLDAPWGMGRQVVSGTWFATLDAKRAQLDQWREGLAALELSGEWGLSQKPGLLLARYLGQSAAEGRKGFEYLWGRVRPLIGNRDVCRPRIWNT